MPTLPIYQSCIGFYFLLVMFAFFSFIYFILVAAQVDTYLCTQAKKQRALVESLSSIFFHTYIRYEPDANNSSIHVSILFLCMYCLQLARERTEKSTRQTLDNCLLLFAWVMHKYNVAKQKKHILSQKQTEK